MGIVGACSGDDNSNSWGSSPLKKLLRECTRCLFCPGLFFAGIESVFLQPTWFSSHTGLHGTHLNVLF